MILFILLVSQKLINQIFFFGTFKFGSALDPVCQQILIWYLKKKLKNTIINALHGFVSLICFTEKDYCLQ